MSIVPEARTTSEKLKSFGLLNFGVAISVLGTYFFKFPNNFSTGGVSGLAVILGALSKSFTPGTLVFLMNMALMVVGFCFFGKSFGLKTGYASIAMSVEIWVLERFVPLSAPFTDQPLLELIFAVMLPSVGAAILFNMNASTGGTDVIAMLLKKYSRITNIGQALLWSDLLIVVFCFFVFGMKTGLFSLLGLAAKAFLVDNVIESINLCKYFTIITQKPDEICHYIAAELRRGATRFEAEGAFTQEGKTVILTVVGRIQGVALQRKIKQIDPSSFVMITNTSEIIGKGFRASG